MVPTHALAIVLVLMSVASGGCVPSTPDSGQRPEPTTTSLSSGSADKARSSLEFIESSSVPVPLHPRRGVHAVVGLRLDNKGASPETIESLELIVDKGLEARYLGWSTCERGCVGTGLWNRGTRRLIARGKDGTYPIIVANRTVASSDRQILPTLIFKLSVETPAGKRLLRKGCLLLRLAVAQLESGQLVELQYPSGFLASIELKGPKPRGYERCYGA